MSLLVHFITRYVPHSFFNISAQIKDSFILSFTCKESYLTFDQEHIIKCGKAFQKFLLPLDILQWSSCVIKMSNITIPLIVVLKIRNTCSNCTKASMVNNMLLMIFSGELVPEDQPLDLKHPPAVFISYQWGVQDKAIALKQYLTESGFSCWLDIGMCCAA